MNNFFSTQKKGENAELRGELNSEYRDKRKEAVKKVIANMTVGKNVSELFADVVKNMQTEDLELKKLVYLYLINYAKTQPELVILVVNTFVKDSDDPNPLIRGLAIRTMGCLRAEKILDYLLEPLKKGLRDEDPYVRKTAALCVAKMFDVAPQSTVDNGLLLILQELLSDKNPMVIANAVAALTDISESSTRKDLFIINATLLTKLLTALNECTEWGQICILSCLTNYRPSDAKEAAEIVERVAARLQHANASLVLAAIRVIMMYMNNYMKNDEEIIKPLLKKMAPPLITLLSSEPEIQYVALRNINIILQKRPDLLSQEIRVFFTKYNDPLYVKLEKLEVMIKLCTEKNMDQVLSELKEYSNEVDVDFVKKSIQAIGRCAVKIDVASEKCVNVLLDLIKTRVSYIVQESITVIKNIFRKYPNRYESIISVLCEHLEILDEPKAKASMIWIIGEYAERIYNAQELLRPFLENFEDEEVMVQLQLLTTVVKLFLKKPSETQELVQKILQAATQGCDDPDVRDRAYIYWRLLSSDPQLAKSIVLAEKPPICIDNSTVSESLLDELIANIASLASVYHISPTLFTNATVDFLKDNEESADYQVDVQATKNGIDNLLDLDFGESNSSSIQNNQLVLPGTKKNAVEDLLSMDLEIPTSSNTGVYSETGRKVGFSGSINTSPVMNIMSLNGIPPQQKALPAQQPMTEDPFAGFGELRNVNTKPIPLDVSVPLSNMSLMDQLGMDVLPPKTQLPNYMNQISVNAQSQVPNMTNQMNMGSTFSQSQNMINQMNMESTFSQSQNIINQMNMGSSISQSPNVMNSVSGSFSPSPLLSTSIPANVSMSKPISIPDISNDTYSGMKSPIPLHSESPPKNATSNTAIDMNMGLDFMGMSHSPVVHVPHMPSPPVLVPKSNHPVILSSNNGDGLEIRGVLIKDGDSPLLELVFTNNGLDPLDEFAIQFNTNSYGLSCSYPLSIGQLLPGVSIDTSLSMNTNGPKQITDPENQLHIALKNNVGVYYFYVLVGEEFSPFEERAPPPMVNFSTLVMDNGFGDDTFI